MEYNPLTKGIHTTIQWARKYLVSSYLSPKENLLITNWNRVCFIKLSGPRLRKEALTWLVSVGSGKC